MKIFVIGGQVSGREETSQGDVERLERACRAIGGSLAVAAHEVLVCSPFSDSADVHVLRGVASVASGSRTRIEFHFVETPQAKKELDGLVEALGLSNIGRIPHPPPQSGEADALRYAWLLCQLHALESSHATIAVGGNPGGAANMLLRLAEARRKPVLPLPFLGGAAKQAFDRLRYELQDRLSDGFANLQDESFAERAGEYAVALTSCSLGGMAIRRNEPRFFISYARGRQAEADHVETLLRRRNIRVFRDESDFGAGHAVPTEIRQAIFDSTVFVALWSVEYACSPWCFDELELALDRNKSGSLELWLLRVDSTRMVPPRARELIYYDTLTRESLEGRVLDLLGRMSSGARVGADSKDAA